MTFVNLYSNKNGEINKFLSSFYNNSNAINANLKNNINDKTLECKIFYKNPIEMSDIICSLIENNNKYNINAWISLDEDVLINVTESNLDSIVRYLYERFPY